MARLLECTLMRNERRSGNMHGRIHQERKWNVFSAPSRPLQVRLTEAFIHAQGLLHPPRLEVVRFAELVHTRSNARRGSDAVRPIPCRCLRSPPAALLPAFCALPALLRFTQLMQLREELSNEEQVRLILSPLWRFPDNAEPCLCIDI